MRFPFSSRWRSSAHEPVKPLARIAWGHHASLAFAPDDVPDDDIETMLALASQAPSGFNLQPWRFVVVRDPHQRARVCHAAHHGATLAEAPVLVVAYGRRDSWDEFAHEIFQPADCPERGLAATTEKGQSAAREFIRTEKVDVWLNRHVMTAFSYLMIAAQALEWDTVPVEDFDPATVCEVLGLPQDAEVVALLAIGRRCDSSSEAPTRLPLQKIVCAERFGVPWPDPVDAA